MELVKLTHENMEKEHICCAISNNKDIQAMSKKNWLKDRLDEGLVFLKGNVRGKCFIEYIPAEYAWAPIEAEGYMYIDCLWVSGQFKGHGYSNLLLDACIKDSKEKGKKGLVILSSKKKMGFLSDPKYMGYKGFRTADTAEPYFELMYLPFEEDSSLPRFRDSVGRQDLYCITQTNAPLRQSMYRYWRRWQRLGTLCSSPYIFRPERMRKGVPRPLQPFPFSMTGSL